MISKYPCQLCCPVTLMFTAGSSGSCGLPTTVCRVAGGQATSAPSSLPSHLPSPPLHLVHGIARGAKVRLPPQEDVEVLCLQPHVPRRQQSPCEEAEEGVEAAPLCSARTCSSAGRHMAVLHRPPCFAQALWGLPPQPTASAPRRQTSAPCQDRTSAGCQLCARPRDLPGTTEHPTYGPAAGTSCLTKLLLSPGLLSRHTCNAFGPLLPAGTFCRSDSCAPASPPAAARDIPQTYHGAGYRWPGTEAGSGQGSSRCALSICPRLYAAMLCAVVTGWERQGCSATRKHHRQPEPLSAESVFFLELQPALLAAGVPGTGRLCAWHRAAVCPAQGGCVPSLSTGVSAGNRLERDSSRAGASELLYQVGPRARRAAATLPRHHACAAGTFCCAHL